MVLDLSIASTQGQGHENLLLLERRFQDAASPATPRLDMSRHAMNLEHLGKRRMSSVARTAFGSHFDPVFGGFQWFSGDFGADIGVGQGSQEVSLALHPSGGGEADHPVGTAGGADDRGL